jgi:hypothetical protein
MLNGTEIHVFLQNRPVSQLYGKSSLSDSPVLYGTRGPDGTQIEGLEEFLEWRRRGGGHRKLWRNFPTAAERVGDSSLGAQARLSCLIPSQLLQPSSELKDLDKRFLTEYQTLNSSSRNLDNAFDNTHLA